MTTMTVSDIRADFEHFEQLLGRLAEEREIVLTSHDQPVARIMPPERPAKPKWPDFAARRREIFGDKVLPGNAVLQDRERYPW